MPMMNNALAVNPPDRALLLLQTAIAHHRAGRLAEACSHYTQVRRLLPRNFDALHLGGTAVLQLGRPAEAIPLLTQALRIDSRSAVCAMRLGLAYLSHGNLCEAEKSLRTVVAQHPHFHEAWDNLGMVLKSTGNLKEALSAHHRSVELQPRYAAGWYNEGLTHSMLGHSATALECHERALKANSDHPHARYGRGQALQQLHRIEEAIAAYDDQLARFPDHHPTRSSRLMALNYRSDLSREALYAEHAEFGDRIEKAHAEPFGAQTSAQSGQSDQTRLKIAFLSPDLRTHAVASFLESLLPRLDREAFDLFLYHDHFVTDATSDRLRTRARLWRNFIGQPDAAVERQIREDAPDILVDLAGHTGLNRLPLFARRLAPVQISYLGYPNTTGLKTMDYRFTDQWADPVGASDAFHTERLVRIGPCAWAYQPPADSPSPAALPCLTRPGVTFGSFNNFSKISDHTLTLWGRILNRVPNSRLVLKSHTATDASFSRRLRDHGIALSRVDLLPSAPSINAHLELYSKMDIALDTYPYHGTTTTCEALWMQRPVITLEGDRHASRVGVSLLNAIGYPGWIASDDDAYVDIAVALAHDRLQLEKVSTSLRNSLQQSPLFDYAGHAALFGAALQACWREHRLGRLPRSASPMSSFVAA